MRWLRVLSQISVAYATINSWQLDLSRPRQLHGEGHVEGEQVEKRQSQPKFLNSNTKRFAVNGSAIPEVSFDVGESYAGLLPIGGPTDTNQLYFWFFPSTNPAAEKEILIWLTGGPGCSSIGELMQENGPFLWTPGVFKPIENKWSWTKLTNVVWVDQPVGTGFSVGTPTATDENDIARQFMGFWKNFVDTFSMQGYKVYVTGSSYSGMYSPYVASAMLDANDANYFDVSGMQIFDGYFAKDVLARDVSVAPFVDHWNRVLVFNQSFVDDIRSKAQKCGYTDYMTKYLVFPPAGVQPAILPSEQPDGSATTECDLWSAVVSAASDLNPCFSVYSIFDRCPFKYDPLGFTSSYAYIPDGSGPVFFNRSDVKKAINAPEREWSFCSNTPVFVNNTDDSVMAGPASQPVIPKVIDRTKNVIIGHGSQDFVLPVDGALLSIQNMTWGGQLGFQSKPSTPLFVPYHNNDDFTSLAGSGVVGTTHTERGLTYFGVAQSGHFLAQDQPALAYRSVEMLLGRVDSLASLKPFTTDTNATVQPTEITGNGTFVGIGTESGEAVPCGSGSPAPITSGGTVIRTEKQSWVFLCAVWLTILGVAWQLRQ